MNLNGIAIAASLALAGGMAWNWSASVTASGQQIELLNLELARAEQTIEAQAKSADADLSARRAALMTIAELENDLVGMRQDLDGEREARIEAQAQLASVRATAAQIWAPTVRAPRKGRRS